MESGTDSEENSIYEKLHEQFETYKTYFKSNKTPEVPEEEDAPVTLEFETKCKGLLEEMLESVNKKLENVGPSEAEFLRLLALKCAITFEKGRTFAQFGDDELGLKAMEEALLLSANHRQLPELSYLVLKIYNISSYLESRSEKYEKAYITLQEASTFYRQITNGDVGDFYTVDDLFSEDSVITPKAESKTLLERLMTNNLQLLSFVSHKVGRVEDYFKCTHEMLERQLRDTENQPLLWALKVGRLAFGFVTQTRFWEARNHLAAAFHILNNYAEQLKKDGVEETATNQYMVQKSRADALETLNIALRELRPPCLITVTIELLRELAEVQLELVGLNLRRLFSINGTYEEGGSELSPSEMLQKMGALTDLHGRLEHFGDSFEFITQPRFFETANETLQQCT